MEDLMEFLESDLELRDDRPLHYMLIFALMPFCTPFRYVWSDPTVVELKLSPLYRTKFMRAWRKLTADAPSSQTPTVQKIQRVVVSTKEQEAMSKMETYLTEIDQLLNQNVERQAKVTEITQRVSDEIDDAFKIYVAQMIAKAQELRTTLDEESKKHTESLQQQMSQLQKYKESVQSGLDSQSAMLIDTEMDGKKREIKIDEITNQTLGAVDKDTMNIEEPVIIFPRDDQSVSEFISSIGPIYGRQKPAPPILDAFDITCGGATIRFHSEYGTMAVRYSLRYRRDIGHNVDDEKESEWREVALSIGSSRYTLNGLNKATKYQLCGRYQLLDTMMWSKVSESFCLTTKVGNMVHVPFEWDPSLKQDNLTLLNNRKDVQHGDDTSLRAVVSKNTLCAEHIASALWEVTLLDMGRTVRPLRSLQIGFVNSNAANMVTLKSSNLGQSSKPNECALYLQNSIVKVRQHGKYTDFDAKWRGSNFKNGDRILFMMDFVQRRCTVSFNDTIAGVLSEDLPNKIRLVANIGNKMTLATSRFEAEQR